jgi:leucyl-tRNA synthetase
MGGRARIDGLPVEYGGLGTMSKSKLNGVDPQDMIDRFGADAARLFVMFAAPPEATLEWSDAGVEGAHRFVRRLWVFAQTQKGAIADAAGAFDWNAAAASVKAARRDVHLALKQANYDYERIQYNTVVSAGMKMLNALEGIPINAGGGPELVCEGMSILIRVLYPVVPHIGCALWDELGFAGQHGSLLDAAWPHVDPAALAQDQIELVLQINGKLRGKLMVPASASRDEVEAAARAGPEVAKHADGKSVKKVIVVPGRLVNVVI